MSATNSNEFTKAWSEEGFWGKLRRYAVSAGREVVEKALLLYYAAKREDVPAWARATMLGALGYFITPLDAIVDLTPLVGYSDDLGVLVIALATVTSYIDDGVRRQAQQTLSRWFGSDTGETEDLPGPAEERQAGG